MAQPPVPPPGSIMEIPVDLSHPLIPTRALAIHFPPPLKTHQPSQIQDLTPRMSTLWTAASGITDENLLSAHKASIVSPPPQVRYTLEKQNMLGTHLAILDAEGTEIAGWNHPILSFGGKTTIKFPHAGDGKESMEIKKVGDTQERRRCLLKKESSTFGRVIENEAVGKVKREVARYAQRSAHEREGLLVMDGAEVDEMVAVLTVCAMAEGKEHFLH
ncbi:hypothetical protein B0J14DRAFT_660323 [Halenospora varia]|nr:hypothetical protein B0J14DRAFT_660323 [Halenospora varia]